MSHCQNEASSTGDSRCTPGWCLCGAIHRRQKFACHQSEPAFSPVKPPTCQPVCRRKEWRRAFWWSLRAQETPAGNKGDAGQGGGEEHTELEQERTEENDRGRYVRFRVTCCLLSLSSIKSMTASKCMHRSLTMEHERTKGSKDVVFCAQPQKRGGKVDLTRRTKVVCVLLCVGLHPCRLHVVLHKMSNLPDLQKSSDVSDEGGVSINCSIAP